MILFLIGFLAGGFLGILLMVILAAGKKEDEIMERFLKKTISGATNIYPARKHRTH